MQLTREQRELVVRALRYTVENEDVTAADGRDMSKLAALIEFRTVTIEHEEPKFPAGSIRGAVELMGDRWASDYALQLDPDTLGTQLEREYQAGDVVREAFLPGLGVEMRHAAAACIGMRLGDSARIMSDATRAELAREAFGC